MKKRALTSVCGLVLILAVLLTFVCVFTIYRDPINEAVLNTLNDIGIDGTHLSAAPESASVAEAAGSLSVSNAGKYWFPNNSWTKPGNSGNCEYYSGNSASNLHGSGVSPKHTYISFKNNNGGTGIFGWGGNDKYGNFKGSITVTLSGTTTSVTNSPPIYKSAP